MKGFGHWDYAEAFTGKEAAHLIAGLDPSLSNPETEYKIRPVLTRMKKAFYETVRNLASEFTDGAGFFADDDHEHFAWVNPAKRRKPEGPALWSVEIEELIANYNHRYIAAGIPEDFEFCESDRGNTSVEEVVRRREKRFGEENEKEIAHWQDVENELHSALSSWAYAYIHEFDDQKFSRAELHRWISENGFPSEYQFEMIALPAAEPGGSDGQQEVSAKSEASYLNIIGSLVHLYWEAAHPGEKYTQATLIAELEKYDYPGMGERNLKDKLTKAKKSTKL
ncbi:hypothetical protein [Agrobacterium tumefaciens]|uniref:hypothetical protein n=1 Tax=Agrobacterium tumefaciens TaxID=358 RepID=UPI0015732D1C|nr:hypothetical protein [Agrobacterium tumefaciens]NTB05807.1 hypothetical protein [Agrobacterium tumefaciens]